MRKERYLGFPCNRQDSVYDRPPLPEAALVARETIYTLSVPQHSVEDDLFEHFPRRADQVYWVVSPPLAVEPSSAASKFLGKLSRPGISA